MTRPRAALSVAVVALATDMLVYGIAVPTLPAIASASGAGQGAVGALFASYAVSLVALAPLAGRWVDRRGFREPMLIGLFGLAAATLLFAASDSLALLLVGRAAQGAAAAVSWTASLALIAASYPTAQRGKAMGIALSAIGIGTLAGPPLGGLTYQHLGRAAPFLLAAGLAAADGLVRWLLVHDPPRRAATHGYRTLISRRPAVPLIALTALGAFALSFMEPILPLHLAGDLDASSTTIGLLFGVATLAASLVAPSFGSAADRAPRAPLALAGTVLAAGAMAGLALASSVLAAGAFLALAAIGSALILVPTLALIGELAGTFETPSYGSAYALYTLAYAAGLAIAPLAAGIAADSLGFDGSALAAAGAILIGGALAAGVVAPARGHLRGLAGDRPRGRAGAQLGRAGQEGDT